MLSHPDLRFRNQKKGLLPANTVPLEINFIKPLFLLSSAIPR
jgi:hypothetical protein